MSSRVPPQTISELWPRKYLAASDLAEPATVKIIAVEVCEFRDQRSGDQVWKPVLTFERARLKLIANKTQCAAIEQITGSERFAEWVGATVRLVPARAHNGKATIGVVAAE